MAASLLLHLLHREIKQSDGNIPGSPLVAYPLLKSCEKSFQKFADWNSWRVFKKQR